MTDECEKERSHVDRVMHRVRVRVCVAFPIASID